VCFPSFYRPSVQFWLTESNHSGHFKISAVILMEHTSIFMDQHLYLFGKVSDVSCVVISV